MTHRCDHPAFGQESKNTDCSLLRNPQSYVLRAIHPISVPPTLLLQRRCMPASAIHFQKLCGLAWAARLAHCPLKPSTSLLLALARSGLLACDTHQSWCRHTLSHTFLAPTLIPPCNCLGPHLSHAAEARDRIPLSGSECGKERAPSVWMDGRMEAEGRRDDCVRTLTRLRLGFGATDWEENGHKVHEVDSC